MFDEDVFKQINSDVKLTKGKFFGILRCSRDYPENLHWNSSRITDQININTEVIRVVEVSKFVEQLPKLRENKLYVVHFECDTRCYSDRNILPRNLKHVDKILNEVTESMTSIWGSNTNLLFLLSHPMYKKSMETRFFKWLYQHHPKHCYRLMFSKPQGL